MHTPRIYCDAREDLTIAGLLSTEEAARSLYQAWSRALRWLGAEPTSRLDWADNAGLDDDTIAQLWQAAHDAVHEVRPGRWTIFRSGFVTAADLREQGSRIRQSRT